MPTVNPVLVNDLLSGTLFPQPIVGETFLLKRDGVSLEVKSSVHGKLSGSGSFYLTNMRLVFHCSSKQSQVSFLAYQIDLHEIANAKFEQPIFGCNYLKGTTKPRDFGDVGDSFRIYFYKGGAGTFLHLLNDLLQRAISREMVSMSHYIVSPENVAFVDPSDPSIVYMQQPIPASSAPPAE